MSKRKLTTNLENQMPTNTEPKIESKSVKHEFTLDEQNNLGADLARAIANLRGTEAEFDQVRASFKARTAEVEARIDKLSTDRMNGFEIRLERCAVFYRLKDRKKDYYLETTIHHCGDMEPYSKDWPDPVLTEEMTREDFQKDLIQSESKFDNREEIELFKPTEADSGFLIVGQFASKWFAALRVKIGKLSLNERLDSEQRAFKVRPDAVKFSVKRAGDWLNQNLKEHAKGFEESLAGVAEAHKERSE